MSFCDFRQNHPEQTQVVDQAFQSLDLHPKDGVLEKNELTAIFTERDTDGILFKFIVLNHLDVHFTHSVILYIREKCMCILYLQHLANYR